MFSVSTKVQERITSKHVTQFVEIIVNHYHKKMSVKLLVKSLPHSIVSIITWNTKLQMQKSHNTLNERFFTMFLLMTELWDWLRYFLCVS